MPLIYYNKPKGSKTDIFLIIFSCVLFGIDERFGSSKIIFNDLKSNIYRYKYSIEKINSEI